MKQHLLWIMVFSAGLTACGGSSDSGSSNSSASSANSPTVVTQGMITGFGSVIVNGVHYDVDDASIEVDDDSLMESELEVGQIVRIEGSIKKNGRGEAKKVIGESQLRGPIESIDLTAGVIVALGQTILINADTFYKDGLTADQLAVGDIIRVSSYTNAEGHLIATHIDLKSGDAGRSLQIVGVVSNLDTTAMTFTINDLLVDYSNTSLSNLPNATLTNEMLVSLQGSLVDDVFVAVGNLRKSRFGMHHDEVPNKVEISGVVTELVSNTRFKIGETTVLIGTSTEFEHGMEADLLDGVLVKVKGRLDTNNNLVAEEIKFKFDPNIESRGLITAIDTTAKTFTVNELTFTVTEDTSFKDSDLSEVRFFHLEDLVVGNEVRVRGYSRDGLLIATRVERRKLEEHKNEDFSLELKGIVEAVGTNSITLSGKEIVLDETTLLEGVEDLTSLLATALGMEVEVKVEIKDGNLLAIKVEIEDEGSSSSSSLSSSSSS